jgi:multiple sugar transport system ATP-binding protein
MNFFSASNPLLSSALAASPASSRVRAGKELTLGVRPSDIVDLSIAAPAGGTIEFSAAPEVVEILGSTQVTHFNSGGDAFRVELDMRSNPEVGKAMRLGFPVETMHVFDKASGLAIR